jgi:hypothetical protein
VLAAGVRIDPERWPVTGRVPVGVTTAAAKPLQVGAAVARLLGGDGVLVDQVPRAVSGGANTAAERTACSASELLPVCAGLEVVVGDMGNEALRLALFMTNDGDIAFDGVAVDVHLNRVARFALSDHRRPNRISVGVGHVDRLADFHLHDRDSRKPYFEVCLAIVLEQSWGAPAGCSGCLARE